MQKARCATQTARHSARRRVAGASSQQQPAAEASKLQPASTVLTCWLRQRLQDEGRGGVRHGQGAVLTAGPCGKRGSRTRARRWSGNGSVVMRVPRTGHQQGNRRGRLG